jgi:hypothetical protein
MTSWCCFPELNNALAQAWIPESTHKLLQTCPWDTLRYGAITVLEFTRQSKNNRQNDCISYINTSYTDVNSSSHMVTELAVLPYCVPLPTRQTPHTPNITSLFFVPWDLLWPKDYGRNDCVSFQTLDFRGLAWYYIVLFSLITWHCMEPTRRWHMTESRCISPGAAIRSQQFEWNGWCVKNQERSAQAGSDKELSWPHTTSIEPPAS